jgi:hypothetical protein
MERNEMEKVYRGPDIDAYCQVWFPLAKLFQRRRLKYEGKMEPNLAGNIYVRSSKASSFGSIRPTNMAVKINSFF